MEQVEQVHKFPSKLLKLAGKNSVVVELCGKESNFIISNADLMKSLNQLPIGIECDIYNCPITSPNKRVNLYEEYKAIHPSFRLYIKPGDNLTDFIHHRQELICKVNKSYANANYVLLLDTCDVSTLEGFVRSMAKHKHFLSKQIFLMLNTATIRRNVAMDTALKYAKKIYGNYAHELVDSLEYYPRTGIGGSRTLTLFKPIL